MTARGVKRQLRFVCPLIVAAFLAQTAAAVTISEDLPVAGGIEALARSLAIDPVPDRARFMFEITRLVHESADIRNPAVASFLLSLRQPKGRAAFVVRPAGRGDVVPVPLSADVWSDTIFRRRVAREDIVLAIVADRQAAWLCHGLTRLDDETLEYFASHGSLLSRLYDRSAPIFAAFAGSVRVHDNRVVPPGGDDAVALWETAVGEKVTRADRFVQALFETADGRLAALYETIGQLDAPHRAFALGLWLPTAAARLERFKALVNAAANAREWHVRILPFNRGSFDLGMALGRLAVEETGAPRPPSARALWTRVIGVTEDEGSIDAAWIAEYVVSVDVRQRGERLDQIGFAQRVFGGDAERDRDLVFVLRALPRFRALLLTFERMGIRGLPTYAAVLRHAAKLNAAEGRRGYVAQAQLQGTLALLSRMVVVGTLETAAAEQLVQELVAIPVDGNGYAGGVARWIRDRLHAALPPARDFESAVIGGLAGPPPPLNAPRVVWEGQKYRLDLALAEANRLRQVRSKQGGAAIDIAMQAADAAHTLATEKISMEELQDVSTQFTALASDLPRRSREEEADNVPAGVAPPVPADEALRKAADEIAKAIKNRDSKRAVRAAEPVIELADDLLARALLSFAYAVSLGEPDGTVLLADDVSHRHDFGYGLKDTEMRARVTWSLPRQEVAPGVAWHVSGSLLGLDVGLATLTLRRVSADHVLEAPKLTTNARDTFATSVSLMDPRALLDTHRDAIATAIDRGRRRVLAATDAAALDGVAAALHVDAARQRALRWTLAHEPDHLLSLISMMELLTLGGGDIASLHAWGMAVVPASGCLCSRLLGQSAWTSLAGRPQLGLIAAVMPDVNLRVAVVLNDLGLPAALARVVLAAAMQDFVDEVRPTDDSDWLSLSRTASTLTRERIEDYIAAATATGPLVPDSGRTPEPAR